MSSSLYIYKDNSLEHHHQERLKELWETFKDDNPKWILKHECMSLKVAENSIFVFSVFEGPAFDHLKSLKARIISAHCILTSLKLKRKLPRSVTPVYSFSMDGVMVCCTNMEKKAREEIYDKVEMMRGKITKIFTERVTHLITTEVGSQKYHAAAGMKIPVMLPDWVLDIWRISENEDVNANDSRFFKHKCPIFNKFVVCASGFTEQVKNEIKKLVESEGGIYRGDLVCGTTTHLVTNEPKGLKYDHAKMWKINTVKSTWIYKSIEAGYCLSEKDFVLESDNQTSTPTDQRVINKTRPKLENIDVSMITGPGMKNNEFAATVNSSTNLTKVVNETNKAGLNNSAFQNNSFNSTTMMQPNRANNKDINNTTLKFASNFNDILKELNLIGKMKIDLFDGIGIFFENFDPAINEKIKRVCNLGGATRFEEYNSDVTHCIVNQVNETKCKGYIDLNPEVNIISIDWLINSSKENQLLDTKPYCVFKNALNSVKTPKKRARPEKLTTPNPNISTKSFDSDLNDCLSQYLNAEAALMKPPAVPPSVLQNTNNANTSTSIFAKPAKPQPPVFNATNSSKIIKTGVFAEKMFQIIGFDQEESEQLANILIQEGADVIPFDQNSQDISKKKTHIDFTLLPLTIPTPISNNNPVTVHWMRKSIENKEPLSLVQDILFQPIPRYNNDRPLSNCVITISGFGNFEKEQIANICKLLGAHIQQSLSLKVTNDIQKNTHLICQKAIGPKYAAAKSWNLPIVGVDWVIESCVTGIKADENKFNIENQGTNTIDLIEGLDRIRRNEEILTNNSSKMNVSSKLQNNSSTFMLAAMNDSKLMMMGVNAQQNNSINNQEIDEMQQDCQNPNDSSLSFHQNDSKKPRLESSMSKNRLDDKNDDEEDNNAIMQANEENNSKIYQKNLFQNNQIQTPLNPRLKELRKQIDTGHTPQQNNQQYDTSINNTNCGSPNGAVNTPVWMKPQGSKFNLANMKINFDLDKAMELLKTPDATTAFTNSTRKSMLVNQPPSYNKSVTETPLDELFSNAIKLANEKANTKEFYQGNNCITPTLEYSFEKKVKKNYGDLIRNDFDEEYDNVNFVYKHKKVSTRNNQNEDEDDDKIQPTPNDVKQKKNILKNCKTYVAKKLAKYQIDIYKKVESLGGDFAWTFNEYFTHFIYDGNLTDDYNELQTVLGMNKIIVRPQWIFECEKQNIRVDERAFLLQNDQEITENLKYDDTNQNDSDKNNIEENNRASAPSTSEIPDSMDIKNIFLHQLQDKLASIKSNTSSSLVSNKKWSRSVSGNNLSSTSVARSESKSDERHSENDNLNEITKNGDLSTNNEETMLSEQQALEELNKSKSRWGINAETNIEKRKKSKSIDIDDDVRCVNKLNESENSDDELLAKENMDYLSIDGRTNAKNHLNKYPRENSNHINKMSNDGGQYSPSLINSKEISKKIDLNAPPPSSQIQMTIWKDEAHTNHQQQTNKSNNTNKNLRSSRNSNENVSTRNLRSDAIADRIISATRVSNKN